MYPNLSYLLHDLIGTDPDNWTSIFQTFGLLMALAFLSAAWNLYSELRRKEKQGIFTFTSQKVIIGDSVKPTDVAVNGIIGFLVGFKLLYIAQNFDVVKNDMPGTVFSTTGSLVGGIAGLLLFAGYKYWEQNSEKLEKSIEKEVKIFPSDRTGDITVVAAITGLLGAKIFALIETPKQFFADPIGELFSGSGLAIYGGLIGGAIGVISYIKWKKISVPHFADAVAPGLILSYGVGRMGCQLSGDGDWGIPVKTAEYDYSEAPGWLSWAPDWVWSSTYPHNVNMEGIRIDGYPWQYNTQLGDAVFATPIWEIAASFAIFGILWGIRKKITAPGVLFCIYLVFNGVERYWIESWRVNDRYDWLPFNWTQAELIAVLLMVLGVALGFFLWRKNKTVVAE